MKYLITVAAFIILSLFALNYTTVPFLKYIYNIIF